MGQFAESFYPSHMTAEFPTLDDLPRADERIIRAHAAELIAMADVLGLSNVRYASDNRVVVTRTARAEPLGIYRLAEEASFALGHRIRVYADAVFANPGVSPDLVAATPI